MRIQTDDDSLTVDLSVKSDDVLWLGSGFSTCVTSGQLPLVSSFFDQLESFESPHLHRFLMACFDNPRKANVEEALNSLDQLQCAPISPSNCSVRVTPAEAAAAKAELGAYCIRRLSHAPLRPNHWAFQLLTTADSATTIVTTNYDCCAEQVLATRDDLRHAPAANPTCHNCKTNAILGFDCECGPHQGGVKPNGRGALLKLHGSISWRTCCSDGECFQKDCIVPTKDHWNLNCSCCNCKTDVVLILPSMTKAYGRFPHLQRMWDSAFEAVEAASRILIFGFSFPLADAAISQQFRHAVRSAKGLREIVVIDANPSPVVNRLRELTGDEGRTQFRSYTVPLDGSVPRWWKIPNLQYRVNVMKSTYQMTMPGVPANKQPAPAVFTRTQVGWSSRRTATGGTAPVARN